jgi:hypothetical protein
MTINADEIYRRLRYYAPKGNQGEVYVLVRSATIDYATAVGQALPESREKSMWLSYLETAQMWANKAIAVNGAHAETEGNDG